MDNSYTVGKYFKLWKENVQNVTFVVTEDCNLRCKYCYITHKKSNKRMNFETAKEFIDLLFSGEIERKDAVILDFIGGEPLIEVELIDKICDYFKVKSYELDDKWYWNYRINIGTNGVNYSDEDVQRFIKKNIGKMSIGMTVDGTKEKHDLQRVFPDGSGSFDIIAKNIQLWINQMGGSTKVTFASDDLRYLKDSIISLWNNGITTVAANVVFEQVWKPGDDKIFENQLIELADYIIKEGLYNKYYCTLFSDLIGGYYNQEDLSSSWCGAGKMLAVDADGKIFPCIRYKGYSLNNNPEWTIGDIKNGIDMEKVRPFVLAMTRYQSSDVCLDCEIASGCAFCQGFDYDESKEQTNFYRATYICDMHKARIRANDYYFSRLFNEYGIKRETNYKEHKKMYFLLSSDYISFCAFENTSAKTEIMNKHNISEGLKFSRENFYEIYFIHSKSSFIYEVMDEYRNYTINHIIPFVFYEESKSLDLKNVTYVFQSDNIHLIKDNQIDIAHCILNIDQNEINNLSSYIQKLFEVTSDIQINLMNLSSRFNVDEYIIQLRKISRTIAFYWDSTGIVKKINLLQYELENRDNCKSGDRNFSLSPDGRIYVCPAFYNSSREDNIGDLVNGIESHYSKRLYKVDNHPLCQNCGAYQCNICVYLNKQATNELNVSPSYQCKKANAEMKVARELQLILTPESNSEEYSDKSLDPIKDHKNFRLAGFYKYDC